MKTSEIKAVLMKVLKLDEAYINKKDNHYQIIAVSKQFSGMSLMKKQQTIYIPLMKYISNNHIHSLSIKTFTPEEWQRERELHGF